MVHAKKERQAFLRKGRKRQDKTSLTIEKCIKRGILKRIIPSKDLSDKELNEAEYDLDKAYQSYKEEDFKWCIVKCYYSMFHAAKALLYSHGFVEKRHIAVIVVLEELNKQGLIESYHINNFKASISAREQADYNYSYSNETAEYELSISKDFLKGIIKIHRKNPSTP